MDKNLQPLTNFVETQALLAALGDDEKELARIVAGMLPGELTQLIDACAMVTDLAREQRARLT